jgi:hypothetical protein
MVVGSIQIKNCGDNNLTYIIPIIIYGLNLIIFYLISLFFILEYDKSYGFFNLAPLEFCKNISNKIYHFNKITWSELRKVDKEVVLINHKINNIICNIYYYIKCFSLIWMGVTLSNLIRPVSFIVKQGETFAEIQEYQMLILSSIFILSYNLHCYIKNNIDFSNYKILSFKVLFINYFSLLWVVLIMIVCKNVFKMNDNIMTNKKIVLSMVEFFNLVTFTTALLIIIETNRQKIKQYKIIIMSSYTMTAFTISYILAKILLLDNLLAKINLRDITSIIITNIILLLLIDFIFYNRRFHFFLKKTVRHGFKMPKVVIINNSAKDILDSINKKQK